jgi:hypothetical protein
LCPARAIQLHHFETDQFSVMIRELMAVNGSRLTVAAGQNTSGAGSSCEMPGEKN